MHMLAILEFLFAAEHHQEQCRLTSTRANMYLSMPRPAENIFLSQTYKTVDCTSLFSFFFNKNCHLPLKKNECRIYNWKPYSNFGQEKDYIVLGDPLILGTIVDSTNQN